MTAAARSAAEMASRLGHPAGRDPQIRPLAGRGPAQQRPGERPGAQQLAIDGGRGRHGQGMRVMLHQFGQPVGADVQAGRVTGHRDLERFDRARWLPPRWEAQAVVRYREETPGELARAAPQSRPGATGTRPGPVRS